MNRIIATVIAGIFALIGGYLNNKSTEPSISVIDNSQNKTTEDSHDTVIINTNKMTKIDNANNVFIK